MLEATADEPLDEGRNLKSRLIAKRGMLDNEVQGHLQTRQKLHTADQAGGQPQALRTFRRREQTFRRREQSWRRAMASF